MQQPSLFMKTKKLGNTDTTVSAIGLGGMPMSLNGRPPQSVAIEVIHRAIDLGVTLIDTADSTVKMNPTNTTTSA
nr:aldo/keto reductase [Pleurocapsa sp. PCC 7327]